MKKITIGEWTIELSEYFLFNILGLVICLIGIIISIKHHIYWLGISSFILSQFTLL